MFTFEKLVKSRHVLSFESLDKSAFTNDRGIFPYNFFNDRTHILS